MKEKNSETNEIQDREGRYADTFRIGHSAYKFVLEFGQEDLERGDRLIHTRLIFSPDNAKAFFETFSQEIKEYEGEFGRITETDR